LYFQTSSLHFSLCPKHTKTKFNSLSFFAMRGRVSPDCAQAQSVPGLDNCRLTCDGIKSFLWTRFQPNCRSQ
jgi:hypothetical protein